VAQERYCAATASFLSTIPRGSEFAIESQGRGTNAADMDRFFFFFFLFFFFSGNKRRRPMVTDRSGRVSLGKTCARQGGGRSTPFKAREAVRIRLQATRPRSTRRRAFTGADISGLSVAAGTGCDCCRTRNGRVGVHAWTTQRWEEIGRFRGGDVFEKGPIT